MSNVELIDALKQTLADTYALYLKTQNYHWNVEGKNFVMLHSMFQSQYEELSSAIDTTAELIRGLGGKAPGTFDAYSSATKIKPGDANAFADQMLQDLLHDHDTTILGTLQKTLEVAEKNKDEVVANFIIERLTYHRKASWMLRSSL